jgi:hypothetical protein
MAVYLSTPDFVSKSALHDWCNDSRNFIRPLAPQLHLAAEELRAVLRQIKGERVGNIDVKYHAMMVARQLHYAASGVEIACKGLAGCYMSFERRFVTTIPAKPSKPKFDLEG